MAAPGTAGDPNSEGSFSVGKATLVRNIDCSKWENETAVTEFLLLGMSDYQDQRLVFTGLLLLLYLLSLFGNTYIVAATNLDPQLHSPMYFFLSNLSFVDLCLTSVIVPKCLANLLFMNFRISFQDCFTQLYLFVLFVSTECFLLGVMSYDRYVAICKPLHYTLVMSKRLCFLLVVACWVLSYFHASLFVGLTFYQCFCGPNVIHSFFCDQPAVLELSCSDTSITHWVLLAEGSFVVGFIFNFILCTYIRIIKSILRLRSAQARKKAFLTCSSHLTVIVVFYGTAVSVYFLPSSPTSKKNNILASLMYTVMTPTLNPFIYSLRNNEIQAAFKKALRRKPFHGL